MDSLLSVTLAPASSAGVTHSKSAAPISVLYCGASPMQHFYGLRCEFNGLQSIDAAILVSDSAHSGLYYAKFHAPAQLLKHRQAYPSFQEVAVTSIIQTLCTKQAGMLFRKQMQHGSYKA